MTDIACHGRTAAELAGMIDRREIGCEELLNLYLERVERFNPKLNAIIVLDADGARERAREADAALARGDRWGPLHGVPMTIKESYNVAGTPTTWGNPALRDNIATEDALSVQRLKAAGVVLFGKTNVPLGLADFQSYNDIYGTTNNPWNTDRIPGGSSGGSAAALAAGITGFESGRGTVEPLPRTGGAVQSKAERNHRARRRRGPRTRPGGGCGPSQGRQMGAAARRADDDQGVLQRRGTRPPGGTPPCGTTSRRRTRPTSADRSAIRPTTAACSDTSRLGG